MSKRTDEESKISSNADELYENAQRLTKEWEMARDAAKTEAELMMTKPQGDKMNRAWEEYTSFLYEHAKILLPTKID